VIVPYDSQTHEPVEGLRGVADFLIIARSAPQQMPKDFSTREQAEDYATYNHKTKAVTYQSLR
jgi:hypothetical protein